MQTLIKEKKIIRIFLINLIRYKLCILGDGGVGKSTLVNRYLTGVFSDSTKLTIGVDFYVNEIKLDDKLIKLNIWDFGGEDRFRKLLPGYLFGASGGIFMFDISRLNTLINIKNWIEVLKNTPDEKTQSMPILLVGGKSDLEAKRSVEKDYAIEVGGAHNIHNYIECSSKLGINILEVFLSITKLIFEQNNIS